MNGRENHTTNPGTHTPTPASMPSSNDAGRLVDRLHELAILDSLGLLDDREVGEFESMLRSAPSGLLRQLADQQSILADLEHLLPDVAPPAELRQRVLDAVRVAIAEREASDRPVRLSTGTEPVEPRSKAAAALAFAPWGRGRPVHRLWRPAALALAAAIVALGTLHVQVIRDTRAREDRLVERMIFETISGQGLHALLFDDRKRQVTLTAVGDVGEAEAQLWYNPEARVARLFMFRLEDLPDGERYRVVRLGDDDTLGGELTSFE
ncbi:MAG: hypothetical protein AAFU70_01175, partial [Planctomycetota bacterium]